MNEELENLSCRDQGSIIRNLKSGLVCAWYFDLVIVQMAFFCISVSLFIFLELTQIMMFCQYVRLGVIEWERNREILVQLVLEIMVAPDIQPGSTE